MAFLFGKRLGESELGALVQPVRPKKPAATFGTTACLAAMIAFAAVAPAQNPAGNGGMPPTQSVPASQGSASDGAAVVRLARFSYVEGQVLWRADSTSQWAEATINLPIREGTQITTDSNAHAEIQFDDGSTLRMTDDAVFTLTKLSSSADGETTELSMKDGTATLHAMNPYSSFQVDTADGQVELFGPARVRLDATSYLLVGVQEGQATFETAEGKYSLKNGDLATVKPSESAPDIEALPAPDDWDAFCESRDGALEPSDDHMPSDVALDAGNLDAYGTWQADPTYGDVWYPSDQTADWQPYNDGCWTWVETFGWTWVSVKAWGWAPYHYGTWIHKPKGWAWVPGPKHQRWSPALVWFSTFKGHVVWTPLAPCEVHYTEPKVAFKHGDWSKYFSIGGCGTYLAAGPDYVVIRGWPARVLNQSAGASAISPKSIGLAPMGHAFRPHNSVTGGTVVATVQGFLAGKGFQKGPTNSLSMFLHGSTLIAKVGLVSGPANVRPTAAARSPKRVFVENPTSVETLNRPVFRLASVETGARPSSPNAAAIGARPKGLWNSSSPAVMGVKAGARASHAAPSAPEPMPDVVVRRSPRGRAPGEGNGNPGSTPQPAGYAFPGYGPGSPHRETGPSNTPNRPGEPPRPAPMPQAPRPAPQPQAPAPSPEPPRQEAPRPEPPRPEPPRPEPPRPEPPRPEPPRPEPPHEQPPQKPEPGKH